MEKKEGTRGTADARVDPNIARLEQLKSAEGEARQEIAERSNLFDIDELLNNDRVQRKLVFEDLGFHVYWCPLNAAERAEIFRIKDSDEEIQRDLRNRKALFIMLHKAEERWTEEQIDSLQAAWVDAILIEIGRETSSFLRPRVITALGGLRPASRRKKNS